MLWQIGLSLILCQFFGRLLRNARKLDAERPVLRPTSEYLSPNSFLMAALKFKDAA